MPLSLFLIFLYSTAAAAKLLQSCPTLCDPIEGSPPGSPIPGILQARPLEWVAISFSNAWKWKVKVKSLSRVWLLATPWTAAHQAPPSMGVSRQEYWSGVPLPSPSFTAEDGKDVAIPHLEGSYIQNHQITLRFSTQTNCHLIKATNNFAHTKKSRNMPQEYLAPFSFAETLSKVVRGRLLQIWS